MNVLKHSVGITVWLLAGMAGFAQPANDNCPNAQPLCPNDTTQGTTISATTQCSGPDGDCSSTGTWGQCYDVNNSVWFTFTTNSNGGLATVTISNISCINTTGDTALQGVLLSVGTPCDALTYTQLDCHTGDPTSFVLTAVGLAPNTQYWVHIDGDDTPAPYAECDFDIMVSGPAVDWIVNTTSIPITCNGDNDGTATALPQAGVSPYTYLWDTNANSQTTQTATGLSAGTYQVTITDSVACDTIVQVTVTEADSLVAIAVATNPDCLSDEGTIVISASGGTPPYSYSIDGSSPQSGKTFTKPAGSYIITVYDDNGCEDTTFVVITENDCPPIVATTGFSPNGDGINDTWSISNWQYYENCQVTVFDRWGQKVFNQTGYQEPWDGTSLSYPVPTSTYYYLIWYDKKDKSKGHVVGYVAVVR